MQYYLELGFPENLSQLASTQFTNVHEGTEWLLRETNKGKFPKRFKKENGFQYTFYDSRVEYEGCIYRVSDYESKYNIILLESCYCDHMPFWTYLSDPGLMWVRVSHHAKPVIKTVLEAQKHFVGTVHLPCNFMCSNEEKIHQIKKALKNKDMETIRKVVDFHFVYEVDNSKLVTYWFSLLQFTDKYNTYTRITPKTPPPKISMELENKLKHQTQTKIDIIASLNEQDEQLEVLKQIVQDPKQHLLNLRSEYNERCQPAFDLDLLDGKDSLVANLYMNHNIFKDSMTLDSKHWIHLNNVFELVKWGKQFVHATQTCLEENNIIVNNNTGFLSMKTWAKLYLSWANRTIHTVSRIKHAEPHQQQAIDWMLRKEMENHQWTTITLKSGFTFYKHLFGNISMKNTYTCNGGMLVQWSGAGKTFSMLKTIQILHFCPIWKQQSKNHQTLIVLDTNMIHHWLQEIKRWTDLTVCIYHGKNKTIDNSDIVLTTYTVLLHNKIDKKWRRIVLDDGHRISNMDGGVFKAVNSLQSEKNCSRWILTKRPIQRNVSNMCAYFRFLRLYPFWNTKRDAKSTVWALSAYSEMYSNLCGRLCRYVQDSVLLQTKETVQFNDASVDVKDIYITTTEQHIKLLKLAQNMYEENTNPRIYNYLRLATSRPLSVPNGVFGTLIKEETIGGVQVQSVEDINLTNKTFEETVRKNIQNGSECPICFEHYDVPLVTPCGHIFCSECITNHFTLWNKTCPCCREPVEQIYQIQEKTNIKEEKRICFHPLIGTSEVSMDTIKMLYNEEIHSKNDAMVKCIKPGEKTVIFTYFKQNVTHIANYLKQHKIQHVIFESKMTLEQRKECMQQFCTETDVFIFSSLIHSVDLRPTQNIIFYEPSNKINECISRINRLGRKPNPIQAHVLITKNSVEEDIKI